MVRTTRVVAMATELCSTCSQLIPQSWKSSRSYTEEYNECHTIGSYAEIVVRALSLGPGRGGCGGCAFFCAILQSPQDSSSSSMRLSDETILEFTGRFLHVKTPNQVDGGFYEHTIPWVLCTTNEKNGGRLLGCAMCHVKLKQI